jgi:primosomal replication protein N
MSLNRAMIIGNLGQDPEIRYTPSGLPVVNFSLATDERYLDKEGKRQEGVQWHQIVAMGKLALTCNEYLKKGRQVFVEGRLRTENGKTTAQTFDAPRSSRTVCSFWARRRLKEPRRFPRMIQRCRQIRKFHSEFATDDSRPLWCPLLLLNIVGTQRSQVARLTFAESVLATQCGSRLQ